MYRAWAEYRNTKIKTAVDEYSSVTLAFKTISVKEVDYWLTRFILEARREDGKPYPARGERMASHTQRTVYITCYWVIETFQRRSKEGSFEHPGKKRRQFFIIQR